MLRSRRIISRLRAQRTWLLSVRRSNKIPWQRQQSNFCQGFAEGAVEIALSYSAAGPQSHRPFCLPAPPPTLDQAASDFATWANSDPARLQKPAAVGLITYLISRYPCPHEATTPRHPHG